MSPNVKKMTKEEWLMHWSNFLADESLKIVNACGQKPMTNDPEELTKQLTAMFLSQVMKKVLSRSLDKYTHIKTAKEAAKHLDEMTQAYARAKLDIQDAVAVAFEGSARELFNEDLTYFCRIEMVPEPTNGMVN